MKPTRSPFHQLVSGAMLFATGRLAFQPEHGLTAEIAAPLEKAERRSLTDRIGNWMWERELREREAYLAKSADVFELEERIRQQERGPGRWMS